MRPTRGNLLQRLGISTCLAAVLGSSCLHAADPKVPPDPTPDQSRKAVERALAFVEKDAAKWRKEHTCASCHHGAMTVWALSEAKAQGYPVAAEMFAETTKWTKGKLKDLDKPRDSRPGFNMVNTPAVYLAMMSLTTPKQDALAAEELKRIARHLLRHQEANGSWAWSIAPPKNSPPPVFESDEVVTLMAVMALKPHEPADPKEKSDARDGRQKAEAWLAKAKPTDSTQSLALQLFRNVRDGKPAKERQEAIARLLERQNKDGGWGQVKDLPSDAYATGQALYFLSLAGVEKDRGEIKRAVSFLVAGQNEDGSWPMKSRAHPGEKPMTDPAPITYFGSAWATMGLMCVVGK